MKIELLHIDDYPSWQNGLKNLEAALQEEGIEGTVELVKVMDNADANRLKLLGSPSFCLRGGTFGPKSTKTIR